MLCRFVATVTCTETLLFHSSSIHSLCTIKEKLGTRQKCRDSFISFLCGVRSLFLWSLWFTWSALFLMGTRIFNYTTTILITQEGDAKKHAKGKKKAMILKCASSINLAKEAEKRKKVLCRRGGRKRVSSNMGPEIFTECPHHSVFNGGILCGIIQLWKTAHIYIIHAEQYERRNPPTRSQRIRAAFCSGLRDQDAFSVLFCSFLSFLEKVNWHNSMRAHTLIQTWRICAQAETHKEKIKHAAPILMWE